ncbi:MAG: hypothetical protein KDA51_19260 [Planctomycetales bacterium]|nr:hypothetical protein [Planctomycetales bacterium]
MRQQQPFHVNTLRFSVFRTEGRESQSASSLAPWVRRKLFRLAASICMCAATAGLTGCNSFGNSRLVKELQSENDRLLSEFRSQRDRAAELEKTNQMQAARLAESEKLLARLSQGSGAGRLSSLPHVGLTTPATGKPAIGTAGSNLTVPATLPSSAVPGELRWQPRARVQ